MHRARTGTLTGSSRESGSAGTSHRPARPCRARRIERLAGARLLRTKRYAGARNCRAGHRRARLLAEPRNQIGARWDHGARSRLAHQRTLGGSARLSRRGRPLRHIANQRPVRGRRRDRRAGSRLRRPGNRSSRSYRTQQLSGRRSRRCDRRSSNGCCWRWSGRRDRGRKRLARTTRKWSGGAWRGHRNRFRYRWRWPHRRRKCWRRYGSCGARNTERRMDRAALADRRTQWNRARATGVLGRRSRRLSLHFRSLWRYRFW